MKWEATFSRTMEWVVEVSIALAPQELDQEDEVLWDHQEDRQGDLHSEGQGHLVVSEAHQEQWV